MVTRLLLLVTLFFAQNAFAQQKYSAGIDMSMQAGVMKISQVQENLKNVNSGISQSMWAMGSIANQSWLMAGGGIFYAYGTQDSDSNAAASYSIMGGGAQFEARTPRQGFNGRLGMLLGGASVSTETDKMIQNFSLTGENSEQVKVAVTHRGGGFLTAPRLAVGYDRNDWGVELFAKRNMFFVGSTKVSSFNATYVGLASRWGF